MSPSLPPTPDPYDTANAQQMANVAVANANTALANADQHGPEGSTVFTRKLDEPISIPIRDEAGIITGEDIIYRWVQTKTLTPKGQIAFDAQQSITVTMNEAALAQAQLIKTKFVSPFSLSMLPARAATPTAAVINKAPLVRRQLEREIGLERDTIAEKERVRQSVIDRLNWQINDDRSAKLVELRNQGIPTASDAWERAMRPFDRQMTDARLQAEQFAAQEHSRLIQETERKATFYNSVVGKELELDVLIREVANKNEIQQLEAGLSIAQYINVVRQQAMQEILAERSTVFNETSALTKGGQITIPQFQQFNAAKIADTPIMDAVYRSAAMDMQKAQIESQQQGQMFGGMMSLAGNLMMMSDRRLKTDIRKLSDDARGFGWYVWRYLWDRPGTRRFGVMAQEVRHIRGAVVELPCGALAVDYGKLAQ
jgi:hypothetical protein